MNNRFDDFDHDPITLARRLLGQRLVRVLDGERLSGIIVEVEAYLGAVDRAAHTYGGRRTTRNESMYMSAGHTYVYFTYGMHHCINVVAGATDEGVAVLIRALEPQEGLVTIRRRRTAARRETDLTSGPAKLTQAFAIDRELDGLDLRSSPLLFIERLRSRSVPGRQIGITPRVGVDYAGDWARKPLRFLLDGNPHVSRTRLTVR